MESSWIHKKYVSELIVTFNSKFIAITDLNRKKYKNYQNKNKYK